MSHGSGAKRESVIGHHGHVASVVPEGMLAEYRRLSPPDMNEQVAQFRRMRNSEQRELLFYMIAHATKGVMLLQMQIDPKSANDMNFRDMSPTKQ